MARPVMLTAPTLLQLSFGAAPGTVGAGPDPAVAKRDNRGDADW